MSAQNTLTLEAHTPTEASFLARDLLQFGVYVEVHQVKQITNQSLVKDAFDGLPASMEDWVRTDGLKRPANPSTCWIGST